MPRVQQTAQIDIEMQNLKILVLVAFLSSCGEKRNALESVIFVQSSSGTANIDLCVDFNSKRYELDGCQLFVVPTNDGYAIVANKPISKRDAIFNFVSAKLNRELDVSNVTSGSNKTNNARAKKQTSLHDMATDNLSIPSDQNPR